MSVEVEVVDYEGILEKTFPKDDNQNKNQDQGQEKNQSLNEETQDEEESLENKYLPKEWRISKDHLIHNLFGYISKGVTTRHSLSKVYNHMVFFSKLSQIKLIRPSSTNISILLCKKI